MYRLEQPISLVIRTHTEKISRREEGSGADSANIGENIERDDCLYYTAVYFIFTSPVSALLSAQAFFFVIGVRANFAVQRASSHAREAEKVF